MNPEFSRFQKLPFLDVLLSAEPKTENCSTSRPSACAHRLLSPLPEREGQGEGKRAASPMKRQIESHCT